MRSTTITKLRLIAMATAVASIATVSYAQGEARKVDCQLEQSRHVEQLVSVGMTREAAEAALKSAGIEYQLFEGKLYGQASPQQARSESRIGVSIDDPRKSRWALVTASEVVMMYFDENQRLIECSCTRVYTGP